MVQFSVESVQPWPYMRCYCSICRKTSGAGGYGINLGGSASTLKVRGQEHTRVYQAVTASGATSAHERHFCVHCGSHLWAYNKNWPELLHPVAGAVDTPLPPPPQHVHIMLQSKASWVPDPSPGEEHHNAYPLESLAAFHQRHGYLDAP